ncbi:hypothetical protein DLAC_10645 [Tieghemostelium lacteum]|uniref:Uncharacterized protein n=1 Tax=Tieghemostelium lacteum TaxID=361077 RepID=A0A151Z4E4_TIELA|nr:hypothetical protein DLAC_10645 [Tieghemostelium lacteum]|eukprot:KYQ88843.1 hypothetical protein DLAC_10645 [Tieghemostelium lacteum]
MKIGSGRLRLSKLPEAPPSPELTGNNNTNTPTNSSTTTSKSSPHLVYSDTHPITSSSSTSSDNLKSNNNNNNSNAQNQQQQQQQPTKIMASQSKSSGALLTPSKHKWGAEFTSSGINGSGGANDIYKLLAEQKLSDEDIWEGHPSLFPILHQFKDVFQQKEGGNVLSVILPDHSDFIGVKKRTYKIGKKLTVAQAVNLICKKQNVREPRRFWLSTIVGCVLNDDLLLTNYGFGTFFDSWELKLIFKSVYLDKIITDPVLDQHPGDFIIDFQLPPLSQFNGLKKKRIKVDSLMPINQIIESIWKKYKIQEPSEKFSIITTEEFPLVLNAMATLSHYGQASTFQSLELSIIYTEFIPPYSLRSEFVPSYGSFQVGKVDASQSKAVVVDLENKLHQSMHLNDEMVANIKKLIQDIKDKEQEIKDKEQQHLHAMNLIEERVTILKNDVQLEKENYQNQINQLTIEKQQLHNQIESLKLELEELNDRLYKEKTAHTEQEMELNYKISQQKENIENLEEKLTESVLSQQDTQERLDQITVLKDEEASRYIEQIGKLKFQYHDLVEKHKQQEQEQEEISNRMFSEATSTTSTNTEIDLSSISGIEQEQLLLNFKKLTQDLADRDVLIKTVYPKKIQSLESSNKRLDGKIQDLEKENHQSSQTIAIQSLEIKELRRQLDQLKNTNKELSTNLESTTTNLKEEEKKNRKLMYEIATLNNELEHERLQREDLNKTIVDLEATKMAVEISAKQRETILLAEIEELKKPKPPPMPTYEIKNLRSPDTDADGKEFSADLLGARSSLKKPPPLVKYEPKEHAIHTVADILFVSMQKRFKSIQDDDQIEDLDDDFNDEFDD